ncbi:nucleotidyltransferase domain-containing protein [Nocardioides perillae]|uniref:Nucleotidyltransferase family protein n=1 Tax=Nocardioides perillae TaxID=1119534 RepID=A0A7Y9RVU1_9ACTN|nr:nucleotidyltransferase family protein [Nocardioides perillae]NYG56266.1 hypothetical protein [Nocardioides perillae]
MSEEAQQRLREALKTVAVVLKEGDTPFALAGSYGLWARGAPEPVHDVDFVVAEEDAARVERLLADHGLEVQQPPEDWLFKVWQGDAMVDVLFRALRVPVTREQLADVDCLEVESVLMPVLSATELMAHKLGALEEHACDLGKVLPAARAVREQVDWERVAEETGENPFADAALHLLRRLGVAPERPNG